MTLKFLNLKRIFRIWSQRINKLAKSKDDLESRLKYVSQSEEEANRKIQELKEKYSELEAKYWKKDEDAENLRNDIRNLK